MVIIALQMMVSFKDLTKTGNIIKIVIGVACIMILYKVYSNTYEQQILKIRKDKDHYFRTSINSPIAKKEQFEGLEYFKPDPKYKVLATLKLLSDNQDIEVTSSDGRKLVYKKFAIASFLLGNRNFSLTLLKSANSKPEDNVLFLPFTDKTNGEETYMSGRYLDVEYSGNETVTIDFNQAYHPYCLYNYKYSCPIPPSENYLDIVLPAGERIKHPIVH